MRTARKCISVELFIPEKLAKHGVALHFSQNSPPHQDAGKSAKKLPYFVLLVVVILKLSIHRVPLAFQPVALQPVTLRWILRATFQGRGLRRVQPI